MGWAQGVNSPVAIYCLLVALDARAKPIVYAAPPIPLLDYEYLPTPAHIMDKPGERDWEKNFGRGPGQRLRAAKSRPRS